MAPHLPDQPLLVVNINPLYREALPRDPQAIQNRIKRDQLQFLAARDPAGDRFVKR